MNKPDNHVTASPAQPLPDPIPTTEIDRSCRVPVMVWVTAAALWLLGGSALGLLAAIKLHAPSMLAGCSWVTFGRVQPAAWNAIVFGFLTQAAWAVGAWILARLGSTTLKGTGCLVMGAMVWNVALGIGVTGILAGHGTGIESLELPGYIAPVLFSAIVITHARLLETLHHRREREMYSSQWFLLGALFVLPWAMGASYMMGVYFPVRGVLLAAVGAWYGNAIVLLWLGVVALAVVLYLQPKLSGQPLPSRSLSTFAFWTILLFGGFSALQRFGGGPFPAYMPSFAVVAGGMLIIPAIALGLIFWKQPKPAKLTAQEALIWKLARFSGWAFILWCLLSVSGVCGEFRRMTGLTLFGLAQEQLLLQGVAATAILAGLYFAMPKVLRMPWPKTLWITAHTWLLMGVVLFGAVVGLIGGLVHGAALNDASVPFLTVMSKYLPFASMGTLGYLLMFVGAVCFLLHWGLLVWAAAKERCLPHAKALLDTQPPVASAKV